MTLRLGFTLNRKYCKITFRNYFYTFIELKIVKSNSNNWNIFNKNEVNMIIKRH